MGKSNISPAILCFVALLHAAIPTHGKSLTIGATNNFPPINLLDRHGKLIGFGREIATAAFLTRGIEVVYRDSSYWPEVLDWLHNGQIDLIHDAAFTQSRNEYLDFSEPIIEMDEVIFVLNHTKDINTLDSLRNKKVACINKHITHLYLQELSIPCNVYRTPIDGVSALLSGNVDAFIYPKEIVLYYLQQLDKNRSVKIVGDHLRTLQWSMVVKKGDSKLINEINEGIKNIKANGAYQRIYNKWFGEKLYFGYNRQEFHILLSTAIMFSLLLGLIMGLIWRHRRLTANHENLELAYEKLKGLQYERDQFFVLSADLLCISDVKGRFLHLSPSWEKTLGYSQNELKSRSFLEFIHPDDRKETKEAVAKFSGPMTITGFVNRYRHANGDYRWFQWNGVSDPKFEKIYATARDITDIKERDAELERIIEERTHALRENENRLDHLLSSSPAVIYTRTPFDDLTATYVSKNVEDIFGIPAPDFIKDPDLWANNIHPDDAPGVLKELNRLLALGTNQISYRFKMANGDYHWIQDELKVVTDDKGQPIEIIGYWIDITELKNTEKALIHSKDLAEKANLAKSEFLSNMSHELRTPLNAILGFSQLLKMELTDIKQNENVQEIINAGKLLLELINDILDLSTIESGNMHLQMEECQLDFVINESLAMVEHMADKRKVRILPYRQEKNYFVRADETRIKQVILNLLSNAIKYNHPGGEVEIRVEVSDGMVTIIVRDTGPGISSEQERHLFKPFDRAGAENSNVEGTGIGLLITKRLVEMMGGRLGYQTQLGIGSRFWVQFALCETGVQKFEPIVPATGEIRSNGKTILCIEDNPASMRLIKQVIENHTDFRLLAAENGEDGLELARNHLPDVILLDINLPGMSGYDVLKKLRSKAETKTLYIIALSSRATEDQINRGLQLGFDSYLTKPVQVRHLLDTLNNALAVAV